MPIPFETLIPYAIVTVMFGVSGAGVSKLKNIQGGGKRTRRSIDQWDRQSMNPSRLTEDDERMKPNANNVLTTIVVMDRDLRLTGWGRGQTDNPIAPPGFELNNPWKVEKRIS